MTLIRAEQLDTSPVGQLVEGMTPDLGCGFLYGPSYLGKTLIALQELALAVANGTPFLGHGTTRGIVAYLFGEGLTDAGVRLKARRVREQYDRQQRAREIARAQGQPAAGEWLASLPPYTDANLLIMPRGFEVPFSPQLALGAPPELRRAVTEISTGAAALAEEAGEPDLALGLVVLDAAADFTSLSLNNDTSANRFMHGLKWVSEKLDCFVLAIAHPAEKNAKTMSLPGTRLKNSSDWVARIEPDLEASADGTPSATIIAEKVKSGGLFDPVGYVIEKIQWKEPDPETGGMRLVRSATIRARETPGLPDMRPDLRQAAQEQYPELLPQAEPVPEKPRKRNGIKPRTACQLIRPAAPSDRSEQAPEPAAGPESLDARLLSVTCPVCQAGPGTSCTAGGSAVDYLVLGARPLVTCHIDRAGLAIVGGQVTEAEVLEAFKGTTAQKPDAEPTGAAS
jgi:hypothetical protein